MFNKAFAKGAAERAIKTFLQTFVATLIAGVGAETIGVSAGILDVSWVDGLSVAALAAILSLATSFGNSDFTAGEPTASERVASDEVVAEPDELQGVNDPEPDEEVDEDELEALTEGEDEPTVHDIAQADNQAALDNALLAEAEVDETPAPGDYEARH